MDNKTSHRSTLRVIEILLVVSKNSDGLTLSEICSEINAPKSSVFPIVHTLLEYGFLSTNKSTFKYTIGISCSKIGNSYVNSFNVLEFIQKEMEKVVSICKETCLCASLSSGDTVYIKKVDSPKAVSMVAKVGITLPAYATGLGKSLLMDYSLEELKTIYPQPLKRLTEYTITDLNVLSKQLKEFRKENVAYESQESTPDICCISVPIRKKDKIIFAISVAMPIYRYDEEQEMLIKSLLLNAKKEIEEEILREEM